MDATATYGIISLLPVVILIVLALVTKRTFESLLVGTLVALIIGFKGGWFTELVSSMQVIAADNVWVFLVVSLLGGLTCVLEKSKAAMGFAGLLSKFATSKKKALVAEWLLSVCLFCDDYLNIMTTAATVKRLNDSHKIHRTLTAYVIGSTSAPVVVLIPLSSWAVYYGALLADTPLVEEGQSAVLVYAQSIPYMFFPMFAMLIMVLVILGIFPLIGPIRKYQKMAEETGNLYPTGLEAPEEEPEEETPADSKKNKAGVIDFILPIIVLVAATIYFDIDVLTGIVVALIFTCVMYLIRRLSGIAEFVDNVWEGAATMFSVLALLCIAFMFKTSCEALGMTEYVISKVEPLMAGSLLPFVVFIVASVLTFALANAWGLSAVMVPLVVPLALAMGANTDLAVAAIFSGSVFGTQACFYSDNAILIGQSTNIRPLDHVATQLPFAVCAAVLTAIMYLVFGFVFS